MTDMDTSDVGTNAKAMIEAAFTEDQAKIVGGIYEMLEGAVGELKGAVNEVKEGLKGANEDIADLRRQNAKSCGILRGPDLPKKVQGEKVVDVFIKAIARKYGVKVKPEDMAACHRMPNGSIIAKFIDLTEGSVFDRLIRRFNAWNPQPEIKYEFGMQVTEYDGTIRAILGILKKEGRIQTYNTSSSVESNVLEQEGIRIGLPLLRSRRL